MSAAHLNNLLGAPSFGVRAEPGVMLERQPAVDELKAARLELDLLTPEEADGLASPMAERLGRSLSLGDELRLPAPPEVTAVELSAALNRVLSTKTAQPVADAQAAVLEARMRSVLEALFGATHLIKSQKGVCE